jgi:hypothetical protein
MCVINNNEILLLILNIIPGTLPRQFVITLQLVDFVLVLCKTVRMIQRLRHKLKLGDVATLDAEVPRAALLLGTPLETECETPVNFFFNTVLKQFHFSNIKNLNIIKVTTRWGMKGG